MINITQRVGILDGLEIISPYPAAFLTKSKALLVSDIHLGIESTLAKRGVFVPDSLFKRAIDSVLIPAKESRCERVYILGDLVHSHRRPDESEWWSVRNFANQVRNLGAEPVVIRGNHDTRLTRILRALKIDYHARYTIVDGFLLTHGHAKVKCADDNLKGIIIGHEHPAVMVRNEFGGRGETYKTFLLVNKQRKIKIPIFVLPSVNPLSFGTDVASSEEFLSPYLDSVKKKNVQPFVLEVGETLLPFPSLEAFRS